MINSTELFGVVEFEDLQKRNISKLPTILLNAVEAQSFSFFSKTSKDDYVAVPLMTIIECIKENAFLKGKS